MAVISINPVNTYCPIGIKSIDTQMNKRKKLFY